VYTLALVRRDYRGVATISNFHLIRKGTVGAEAEIKEKESFI
jgi:hypothetical protein